MNDFNQSPENEQERLLNIMPNYVQSAPPEEFRVGFGRRLGAAILDAIFIAILLLFAMQFFGIMDTVVSIDWTTIGESPEEFNLQIEELVSRIAPLQIAVGIIYYSMEIFFAATLGKIVLGIRIGNEDRRRAKMKSLIIRCITKNISIVFALIAIITTIHAFNTIGTMLSLVIFFGCFMTLSVRRQALHDRIAHTAVYFRDELKAA